MSENPPFLSSRGVEGTVFAENEIEANYRSKLNMIAAACDPRTKLLRGIPDEDKRLLWIHIHEVLLDIARKGVPALSLSDNGSLRFMFKR